MSKLKQALLSAVLLLAFSSSFAETIYVTNVNNDGEGSFRHAILAANADPTETTILFNIPGSRGFERIINAYFQYPAFTAPVIINTAETQTARTILKGLTVNGPGQAFTALTFNPGSEGSEIRNITFRNFVKSIATNVQNVSIINNVFAANQGGVDVHLTNAANTVIQGNIFFNTNYYQAIAGNASSGAIVKGNSFIKGSLQITNSGGVQIGGAEDADENLFYDQGLNAITLGNVNQGVIQNNVINNSTTDGIYVYGIDNIIKNNKLSKINGWDIIMEGGWFNKIDSNKIEGFGSWSGIIVKEGASYQINNNYLTSASIELKGMSANSKYGPLSIRNNTITNDPNGLSGHGAITLFNTAGAYIGENTIHHNSSNGIYLYEADNNTIKSNLIYENFRSGVNVTSCVGNKISKNLIYLNHADARGGRSGIGLTTKAAPVILSARRQGSDFVITGSGTEAGDTVEIFESDEATRNASLSQNANNFKTSVRVSGTTWTATLPAGELRGAVYFMATSTNTSSTTSTFSKAAGVEINGPANCLVEDSSFSFYAENLKDASYSWWTTLPASQTVEGNKVSLQFTQAGIGTVSVGYTDSYTGQYKQYSYPVTVSNPSVITRPNSEEVALAHAYPVPFVATTRIMVEETLTQEATVKIYNRNKDVVYSSTGHKGGSQVEVGNNLQPGIYAVQVIAGSKVNTFNIVKN